MKYSFSIILVLLLSVTFAGKTQNTNFKKLEQQVTRNNKAQKYDASINLISTFIEENENAYYEVYQAYILKSYIYKSLFNYSDTFINLDLALAAGLQSNRKEEVKAVILSEKAFAYFDIQKYAESVAIMKLLKKENYKYMDSTNTAFLIMQDGYIDYLNKKYTKAEVKYDEAIAILDQSDKHNLPVVYGKKIELYTATNDKVNTQKSFELGYHSALESKSVKYQIYLLNQLFKYQTTYKIWEEAFATLTKINDLEAKYNAEGNNNKLQILEKDFENKVHHFEIRQKNTTKNFLIILIIVLIALILLGYKLHKTNLKSKKIIEFEFDKINSELKLLTSQLEDNGFVDLNLSEFKLSARQLEIIELIKKGRTNKEIGTILFISENTVKYHLKTIYEILNIENRSAFFKIIS